MSLARGVLGRTKEGESLGEPAARFNLPTKTVPYGLCVGKRWADMDESLRHKLANGCARDVEITETLTHRFLASFPECELDIIDATVRMFTEPRLVADPQVLFAIAKDHHDRKAERLMELGVTAKQLGSPVQFVALLEEAGETVPSKPSKKGPIPAIAKSDLYMQDLINTAERYVRDLVEAPA
jgi:hypothetical protein